MQLVACRAESLTEDARVRRGISKKVGERQGATDHDHERPVCPVSHPCDCQPSLSLSLSLSHTHTHTHTLATVSPAIHLA